MQYPLPKRIHSTKILILGRFILLKADLNLSFALEKTGEQVSWYELEEDRDKVERDSEWRAHTWSHIHTDTLSRLQKTASDRVDWLKARSLRCSESSVPKVDSWLFKVANGCTRCVYILVTICGRMGGSKQNLQWLVCFTGTTIAHHHPAPLTTQHRATTTLNTFCLLLNPSNCFRGYALNPGLFMLRLKPRVVYSLKPEDFTDSMEFVPMFWQFTGRVAGGYQQPRQLAPWCLPILGSSQFWDFGRLIRLTCVDQVLVSDRVRQYRKTFEPRKALWIQHCQGEYDDDHNHDDGQHDHTHDDHHYGHNHDHDHGSLAAGSHEIMQQILVCRLKQPILHLAITSDQI